MPELPEVETVRSGLAGSITGLVIQRVVIRQSKLRFPVPENLPQQSISRQIRAVRRRGKYLLWQLDEEGFLLWHLGMSGSIWVHGADYQPIKHDHVLVYFDRDVVVRYHDPRRFGMLDYCQQPESHRLLQDLGPEPFSEDFSPDYVYQQTRNRTSAIKTLVMNSHIVVGVGNIYACESLFHAGIRPERRGGTLTHQDCQNLVQAITMVLTKAIDAGGSTLKDFVSSQGTPGYFQQELFVYGRDGLACLQCSNTLQLQRISNRASVYCPQCQK